MSQTSPFAHLVALVGKATVSWRKLQGPVPDPAIGATPVIPKGKPQGAIPTLKMPTAQGWAAGQTPTAAPGLRVNAFASGLDHPRWLLVLPNGDVTVAESSQVPGPLKSVFGHAMASTMRRAKAMGESANRITLLRDTDGDGVAEHSTVFLDEQPQPFGMALLGHTFYVGNTNGVVAFDYTPGATAISPAQRQAGRKLTSFKPGGHWTRSLLPSLDGQTLYAGVGSLSNIAEGGFEVEQGRACIYAIKLGASTEGRGAEAASDNNNNNNNNININVNNNSATVFASGLRNAVGMAFEPSTGQLWTVVNERDGLGDETPPDYLTSVRPGGFYGWPYCYWGQTVDDRVPQDAAAVASAVTPDYALGGHTASLGLCWMPAGTLPGFGDGMVIGQHGSWNRSVLSGYKVIFVPFENGHPAGPPKDILSGFLASDESVSYGRPVGVAVGPHGKSLLVADDVGNVVWRVSAAR